MTLSRQSTLTYNSIECLVTIVITNIFSTQASKYKAAIFPVAGAVIGTALGGPVGLAVGIKLGALAGAVGGTAGK